MAGSTSLPSSGLPVIPARNASGFARTTIDFNVPENTMDEHDLEIDPLERGHEPPPRMHVPIESRGSFHAANFLHTLSPSVSDSPSASASSSTQSLPTSDSTPMYISALPSRSPRAPKVRQTTADRRMLSAGTSKKTRRSSAPAATHYNSPQRLDGSRTEKRQNHAPPRPRQQLSQIDKEIAHSLSSGMTTKDLGTLYICRQPEGNENLVKVGWTAGTFKTRMKTIQCQCKIDLVLVETIQVDSNHYKCAEKLAHAELNNYSHESPCDCTTEHKEWFLVKDHESAVKVVNRWKRFASGEPWDETRKLKLNLKLKPKLKLKPFWQNRLDHLRKTAWDATEADAQALSDRWEKFTSPTLLERRRFDFECTIAFLKKMLGNSWPLVALFMPLFWQMSQQLWFAAYMFAWATFLNIPARLGLSTQSLYGSGT